MRLFRTVVGILAGVMDNIRHQFPVCNAITTQLVCQYPADIYEGRRNDILDQRAAVKTKTMVVVEKKVHNLRLAG